MSAPALKRTPAVLLAAAFVLVASLVFSRLGASISACVCAFAALYAFGYVAGALVVPPAACVNWPICVVRLVGGLLLTSAAYLLSLRLSVPWMCGPAVLVVLVFVLDRRSAWGPVPQLSGRLRHALTLGAGAVLFAPTMISACLMARGAFPPIFFNVDTPYFLEKVHALMTSARYPPPSLGVLGGQIAYHFGIHSLTAFIAKVSGLAPHHALFLFVVPALVLGVVAAAIFCARALAPALPSALTAPLLLVAVPADPLWDSIGRRLADAWSLHTVEPLRSSLADYELWNVAFNNAHNLAAHFLVLATIGAVASAPRLSWRPAVIFAGSAMLFKSPVGVALVSGLVLAQGISAAAERRWRPLVPALAAVIIFGGIYGTFWLLPLPAGERPTVEPLYFVRYLQQRGGLLGFGLDLVWLFVPALIMATTVWRLGIRTVALLGFVLAPLLVVNTIGAVSVSPFATVAEDWVQIVLAVPLLVRAFVIAIAGVAWTRAGLVRRRLFSLVVALTVLIPSIVSVRYAGVLLTHPEQGHEYVDNGPIAEALSTIPVAGTIIVTNDLRYPAEGFRRADRQMQIPALFGHQAFAVNYFYEFFSFSNERHALQQLLSAPQWTSAIDQAASAYHWTHLLIRKDYPHPTSIPLEKTFENDAYAVFRFSDRRPSDARGDH